MPPPADHSRDTLPIPLAAAAAPARWGRRGQTAPPDAAHRCAGRAAYTHPCAPCAAHPPRRRDTRCPAAPSPRPSQGYDIAAALAASPAHRFVRLPSPSPPSNLANMCRRIVFHDVVIMPRNISRDDGEYIMRLSESEMRREHLNIRDSVNTAPA